MAQMNIAVIFGGPTTEHDVTIVTAHEVIKALDPTRFTALPVYWAPDGNFYTGAALMERTSFPFSPDLQRKLTPLTFTAFDRDASGRALVTIGGGGFFKKPERYAIDAVIPVAHGTTVEDGNLQGFLTVLGIPFTGPGTFAAALFMNKMATKKLLAAHGVPVLPAITVDRPREGFADFSKLAADLKLPSDYPVIVKPNFLGSSVAVTRADNAAQLAAGIANVFKFDTTAIIEPCVDPLVEYNVSVTRAFGDIQLSAVEKPERKGNVLDFATKYIGDGTKGGAKKLRAGMRFAGRELDPSSLTAAQRKMIEDSARAVMAASGTKGAPRIDFISNGDTGEIWLNEVNAVPGDFASFLWECGPAAKTFTELLTALVNEAMAARQQESRLSDPAQAGAVIFKR
ncbi:MAG: hypothetical protein AB7G06_02670 [Bdellovibrionales bacterium]